MRRVTVLTLLVVLLGGLLVAPAAAGPPEISGDRIWFLCDGEGQPDCIDEFPADTAFWISHGIKGEHGQGIKQKGVAPAAGHNEWKLFLDGQEVEADWTFHSTVLTQKLTDGGLGLWLFVFPEGLQAGTYVFRGEWHATCSMADVGVEAGCERPSDTLMGGTTTFTVNFN
ncbi:MAG: hypothetical protein OEM84_11825 [Acidimicrobiia bacterium]|nr:hypothetical protein [Acidimicrobiia bacterium]